MKSTAVLLSSLALAASAQAGTISYDFSNPLQTTEINQTGSLGLFDSTMGTLTGVKLTFLGSSNSHLVLTNNAAQTQIVKATSSAELYFSSTLTALNDLIQAANPVLVLSQTTGTVSLTPGEVRDFGTQFVADDFVWSDSLNGILGSFSMAGGGAFSLGCTSLSGLNVVGGGGNVDSKQDTEAACGASIVYTYADAPPPSDVPEPAMPALAGVAFLGMWLARRRKQA